MRFIILLSLCLFFSTSAFAQSEPVKLPPSPLKPKQVNLTPPERVRFKVNSPVRFKNSPILVLAGSKDKNSAIYVNKQLAVPANPYATWYYEYPLAQDTDTLLIEGSIPGTSKFTAYSSRLSNFGPLDADLPRIFGYRFDSTTKDFLFNIQDPSGVLSYNIYYANTLSGSSTTSPFILAQADVSVSGTGTTTWCDNGTYTGAHPSKVEMRFYKLEVARVTISQKPPIIDSVTPFVNSTFLAGATVNILVTATDPNNDPLEYQFLIGGTIKQAWSSVNTYIWRTQASDTGTVSITYEVRDNKGGQTFEPVSYSIINPTTEEIFKKITDNYTLVDDKSMDVTLSSKFNTEEFGRIIYTRQYFKKPDKQRTDTFSREDRAESSRTEIQITIGPDAYFIDSASRAQSHKNTLTELNLTQDQLNQMDEIYHPQDFLNAHTVVRLDNPEDLAKGLVMVEAAPKATNSIYSKLGIQIDYFKGIRTKSLIYLKEKGQDKLKQAIEITGSQKISNGAWVPKAQVKTLYFTDGNLIMDSDFTNIQTNSGLVDYLFDPEKQ